MSELKTYTIWVCESNGTGSHHVSAHAAESVEAAKELALTQTEEDWNCNEPEEEPSYPRADLHVLGVVEGDVTLTEWNDEVYYS